MADQDSPSIFHQDLPAFTPPPKAPASIFHTAVETPSPGPANPVLNAATSAVSSWAEPLSNLALRGVNAVGGMSDQDLHRAIQTHPLAYDPARVSGKIGAGIGQAALAVGSGGTMAPAVFGALGGEQEYENIEQRRRGSPGVLPQPISGGQAVADVGGQALLNAGLGYLAPGGAATESLLPAVANPTVGGSLLRTLAAGGIGSTEMMGLTGAGNLIRQQTGVAPNQDITEGMGEAALQGSIFHALPQGARELGASLPAANALQAARERQASPAPEQTAGAPALRKSIADLNERLAGVSREAPAGADRQPEPTPKELDQEDLHHFETPEQIGKPASFAEQLRLKQLSERVNAFEPTERRLPGNVKDMAPEEEQRWNNLVGERATFQSPEEANPRGIAALNGEPEVGVKGRVAETQAPKGPTPSQPIRDLASSYAEKTGRPAGENTDYAKVDPEQATKIANAYDAMKHDPSDPKVKASYDAMKAETWAQYQHLKEAGYQFTPEEQPPHRTSAEVLADLQAKKLGVYVGGDMPADHPLAEAVPENSDGLKTYNDVFRAVHDVFGHGKEGYGFGPRGEENAWRQHAQMYSPEARGAMTAETRGQNSWVNFGPHGEANRANPAETKYAEQKAGLLPEEHTQPGGKSLLGRLASEEAGGSIGEAAFVKHDVIPTVKAAGEAISDAVRGIRRTFGGQKGEAASTAKEAMKLMGAERAQRADTINDQVQKMQRMIDKLSVAEQRAITDSAEGGAKQTDPKMQAAADALRDLYDDRLSQIQKRDPDFKGIEDYMGHAWKDPRKASALIADYMKKRPLAGDQSFKKSRVFMTQEEGIKAGLEPVTDNPVTMAKMKLQAMDKWITAFDARETLDSAGLLHDAPKTGRLPEGMVALNDPFFRGKMMPEEAASVLNNFLSPGIMGHPDYGGVMRGLRNVGNMMNQASLSLSAIHVTTSAINSSLSDFALGLQHLAPLAGFKGEAKPVEGLKKIGTGTIPFASAIRDYFAGTKIQKEWLKPGSTDPNTALIVDAMKQQGGRAFVTHDYMTGATDKMMQAFRQGNIMGTVLRAPFAGIEQVARPIMEKMVPKLKAAAFAQVARAALADHPNATAEELSHHMGDAWKSVDNRFGEMVHDNRFWNATARQVAQMSMRSVGWNYGTADEIAGAAWDTGKGVGEIASGKRPELTHRMAYAAALPILTGIWGAVMNYGLTGKGPSNLKDLYAVPTGEKDKDGKEIRASIPSYMKDLMSANHNFADTAAHKMHPLISNTLELLNNKDYFGDKVYQEDDKGLKIAQDIGMHTVKGFEPLSATQMFNGKTSTPWKIAAGVGVSKSPKWTSTSEAEQEAYKPIAEANATREGRTTAQQQKHDLTSLIRNKDPEAETQMNAARDAGKITWSDEHNIRKNAQKPGGLKGAIESNELPADYLMRRVWPKMTDEEKAENRPLVLKKLNGANMPMAQKLEFLKAVQQ